MLSLRIRCPNARCRIGLLIPEQLQGQQVRCAGCGQAFLVPPIMPGGLRASRLARSGRSRHNSSDTQ